MNCDAYIIFRDLLQIGEPSQNVTTANLPANSSVTSPPAESPIQPGDIIQFQLQKYTFLSATNEYTRTFPDDIPISLRINRVTPCNDKSPQFPLLLDAFLSSPLLPQSAPSAASLFTKDISPTHDPLLSALNLETRLVFRYDPLRHLGVLVHYGYDLAPLEKQPLALLWCSAFNQDHSSTSSPS